jgi:hypothetical protein
MRGVGTADVGEEVVVDEHVDVRLVVKQQPFRINLVARGVCSHGNTNRVEHHTGLVRFGRWFPTAVVAVGSLRNVGAVLSVQGTLGLVGVVAGAAAGEARDILLLALPFVGEGDAPVVSAGPITDVGAGHAVAPTSTVGLHVLPAGE